MPKKDNTSSLVAIQPEIRLITLVLDRLISDIYELKRSVQDLTLEE